MLDGALDQIAHLLETGLIDPSSASQLQQRERTLRYQMRQLRKASAAAHSDLLSGLELSWEEFERCLGKIDHQKTHEKEQEQTTGN